MTTTIPQIDMPVRPEAELYPLRVEELEELAFDILEHGLQHPIVLLGGAIIDGRRRYLACLMAGVDPVFVDWSPGDTTEHEYVVGCNEKRRHLTFNERVARAVNDLPEFEHEAQRRMTSGEPPDPPETLASQGRKRAPQSRAQAGARQGVGGTSVSQAKRLKAGDPALFEAFQRNQMELQSALWLLKQPEDVRREVLSRLPRDKQLTKRQVRELAYEVTREELAASAADVVLPDALQLIHGDCLEACKELQPNSADLIVTDPPYGREWLHTWDALAEVACYLLKPGGFLAAYSGQAHLPYVYTALNSGELEYQWTIALTLSGGQQQYSRPRVRVGWKPIILSSLGPPGGHDAFADIVKGSPTPKVHHDWEQSDECTYIIQKLSRPGDLIVDPFAGAGTFCRAAVKLGRRALGFEIDEAAHAIAVALCGQMTEAA